MKTKTCKVCGEEKPLDEYHKHKSMKDGHDSRCKKCMSERNKEYYSENKEKLLEQRKEYYSENKDKISERAKKYYQNNREARLKYQHDNKERKKCLYLQRNFGITLDDYNEMLEAQEHRCAGCLIHEDELRSALAVDHCHQTGKIRGLLCDACNLALGKLNDNPTTLRRLTEYLEEHKNNYIQDGFLVLTP